MQYMNFNSFQCKPVEKVIIFFFKEFPFLLVYRCNSKSVSLLFLHFKNCAPPKGANKGKACF